MEDRPRHSTIASLPLDRRRLLEVVGAGFGATLPMRMISAPDRKLVWNLWRQENPGAAPDTVEEYAPIVLSVTEWATLTAVVERFFPKTAGTPGGAETGAHVYIDRTLSTVYKGQLSGYRTGLAAIEASVDGGFSAADSGTQDATLRDIDDGKNTEVSTGFFNTLLGHTRQGMFCDPIHGGNREFMGWDLIGYPGIKLVWSAEDQAIGAKVNPEHASVEKFGGRAR